MNAKSIAEHWQKGAKDSLEVAKMSAESGYFSIALFHCHLAVEKVLKSLYIEQLDTEPPPTHNLQMLLEKVETPWSGEQKKSLIELTDFAVSARYDDPEWAKTYATKENASMWVSNVATMLSNLHI